MELSQWIDYFSVLKQTAHLFMKKFIWFTVFSMILFCANSTFAQTEMFSRADEAFEREEYSVACELYEKIYPAAKKLNKVEKARVSFNLAQSFRLSGNLKKAESWYKKSVSAKYFDPICIYWLANAQRTNNKFEEAFENYTLYLTKVPEDTWVLQEFEDAKRAEQWIKNPTQWQIRNMTKLNSKYNDFSATYMDKRYKGILFTSARVEASGKAEDGWTGQKFTDLFYTKRSKKGKWSKPVIVDGPVNTEFNEGSTTFNKKYNTVYFTSCKVDKKREIGCEIYWAKKKGKGFGDPEVIPLSTDTFACGHPAIAPDDVTLYFTSNMPGGFGGKDIWKSKYNKKSQEWSKAENLGPTINTSGNEMFPHIKSDGTLYFSSDKHVGMGGLDIFKSTLNGGKWSEPENMQAPINSTADDFGIVFKNNLEEGMLTSNRIGGKGRDDVYEFLWQIYDIKLEGYVVDAETGDTLTGSIVTLEAPDGSILTDTVDAKGRYSFDLEQNMGYDVEGTKYKYLNDMASVSTFEVRSDTTIMVNFSIQNTVRPIVLPNILYDVNKWDLRAEAKKSLDGLIETLNDNPNITIELSSHTDFRGTSENNKILAEKRADAAVDYLIEKGIEKERLTGLGAGESKPRVLEEDMGSFKKDDKLNTSFVKALGSDELMEEAHQLNRRTQFKVLSTDFVSKRAPVEEAEEYDDFDAEYDDEGEEEDI